MVTKTRELLFVCSMKKASTSSSKIQKLPNKDLKQLAKRIKDLRIKKGYTNYEYFAYDNNIPRSQFGRYESGEDLRYTSLLKVIRAFDMSLTEFFSEGFDEEKKKKVIRKK